MPDCTTFPRISVVTFEQVNGHQWDYMIEMLEF